MPIADLCAFAILTANSALGAELPLTGPFPPRDFNTYQPSAMATRIQDGTAPAIDGDLSDPVWAQAQIIDEFYQVDPDAGQPPSQTTHVRILYDTNTLYVGIYAYDREPDKIIATVRARDGNLDVDDGVRIFIDPELTRRNAYYFELNALGSRTDALLQNNSTYIGTWNTIWDGAAKRMPDGYAVEMAIPFRDLSFNPSQGDWGLEIQRRVRRTGERIRWSMIKSGAYYADVSREGTLTGIADINQGLGLDIQLFGKLAYNRQWQAPKSSGTKFVMSGNAYYKITPGLTGTLTVDPDFSNSPLDIRQVNTTRFVLFQPETRDFFLQDAAAFEFGGRGFVRSNAVGRDNGRPFFSRNIGLANGRPVSLTTGGKLSGQAGRISIGALSVLTDGTGTTSDRQVLSVARVTAPIFQESKLGLIFTNGDPSGASKNTVAGTDIQLLDSNFFPGKVAQADLYYQRSFSDSNGDDDAFGGVLNFPNEPWGGNLHFKQVGTNYFPALGFVNRTGVRIYDGYILRRDRNVGWRFFDLATSWNAVTSLNNRMQSRENIVETGVSTAFTDEFRLRVANDFEDVPAVFKLASTVPVQPGRYEWTNIGGTISTSDGRPYGVSLDVLCCSFYNGNYLRIDLQFDFRPIPLLQLAPRYTLTKIDLPTGSVDVHLASMDFIVNFTPDMQLFNQLQYDNISQNFTFSLRYRWEYQPGKEIFASFGQTGLVPDARYTPQTSQAVFRLGNMFRF